MQTFEDLLIWKKSYAISVVLYKLFKDSKEYAIRDQIIRSAISIPSNIAEGYERNSKRDFARFLKIAKGSAAELRTQLYIVKDMNLIPDTAIMGIIEELKGISKMIQAF